MCCVWLSRYMCSDRTGQGFLGYSASVYLEPENVFVCVQTNVSGKKRKWEFHFWCDAALCFSKQALGASDQPLHQFTGTVEGLLSLFYSCLLFLFVTFPLTLPSLSPLLLFFLVQCEPLLTLMKRHVLYESLLPTNMRDGWRGVGSRVGQERRGAREYGKRDNAPLSGR